MSTFSTRDESDALVIVFDNAAGLNDFRNNTLRDALYDSVQSRAEPRVALDLQKVDYLSSSGVAILVGLKRGSTPATARSSSSTSSPSSATCSAS